MRLILAEDDPANQIVDRTLLTRLGHTVAVAADGFEVLEQLTAGPCDAVILDCHMPGLDGFETARRIRSGAVPGVDPKILIIALTADAMPSVRERCRAAGMNACLGKPLRPPEMAAALQGSAPAAPAVRAGSAALPLLDPAQWDALRGAPGANGTLLDDFLRLFLRDEPERVKALPRLAAAHASAELSRTAHTIAGSAAILGARQLQHAANQLEQAAAAEDWTAAAARLADTVAAWERLSERLREVGAA